MLATPASSGTSLGDKAPSTPDEMLVTPTRTSPAPEHSLLDIIDDDVMSAEEASWPYSATMASQVSATMRGIVLSDTLKAKLRLLYELPVAK